MRQLSSASHLMKRSMQLILFISRAVPKAISASLAVSTCRAPPLPSEPPLTSGPKHAWVKGNHVAAKANVGEATFPGEGWSFFGLP